MIHEKGITPDIVVPMTPDEEEALALRRSPGGFATLPDEQREKIMEVHDVQMERAMDVLKGITLYAKRAGAGEKSSAKKSEKIAVAN